MSHSAARPDSPPLLQGQGLTVYRGDDPLFADVDLTLAAGEILQIEGSNGSGKTTLLRILCGLADADEGTILWHGRSQRSQRAEFFADTLYLGHKPGIKAGLSAIENLRLYLKLGQPAPGPAAKFDARLIPTDENQLINNALDAVRLSGRGELPCGVLSAGQQRRVALARLLLTSAGLWILDEPLTALDIDGRQIVQGMLQDHVHAGGSLIYTTHQALPVAGLTARCLTLGSDPGTIHER